MITSSELYIGCTYLSVKFNVPVKLTAEDIYELVNDAEGAHIDHYIKNRIEPIQITKEYLIEVGFVDSLLSMDGLMYEIDENVIDITFKNNEAVCELNGTPVSLLYVHNLEKLCYELGGLLSKEENNE